VKLYGKTEPTFWVGATGRMLRGHLEAQVLAHHLISCPSSNMIGLYYIGLPTICYETGLTEEGASKGLQSLSEADFATYERSSGHVYVKNMARIQIGESLNPSDKRHKGVINLLKTLRKSPFFLDFYDDYRVRFVLPSEAIFQAGMEAPLMGLRRGLGVPPKPVAVSVAVTVAVDPLSPPKGAVSADQSSESASDVESKSRTIESDNLSLTINTKQQASGVVESTSEPGSGVTNHNASLGGVDVMDDHQAGGAISTKGKRKRKRKRKRKQKFSMPEDFGVSERVKRWATEERAKAGVGYDRLEERLKHFRGYAIANGAEYVNWDQAFMNAIAGDWAKLNGKRPFGGSPAVRRPAPSSQVVTDTEDTPPSGDRGPCPTDIAQTLGGLGLGHLVRVSPNQAGGVL